MNNKNFTIVLLLIIISITTSNQALSQKCKYEKNEIDGLLEVPIKLTEQQLLCRIDNQPIYAKAQCIGTNKYLKIRYFKYNDFIIQDDKEIAWILPSEEEITLYPRIMPVDSTQMNDLTEVSTLLIYKLSASQYETLKNNPVVKFKYYISTGFVEKEIKTSKQNVIMNVLKCIE